MPTYTPNLGLIQPATGEKVNIDQLNSNFDKLDNSLPTICSSTSRPSTPYQGQMIYETDTRWVRYWDGQFWMPTDPIAFRYSEYGRPTKDTLNLSEGLKVLHKLRFPKLDFPVQLTVTINLPVDLIDRVTVDVEVGVSVEQTDWDNPNTSAAGSMYLAYSKNHDINGVNSKRAYAISGTCSRMLHPIDHEIWGVKVSAKVTSQPVNVGGQPGMSVSDKYGMWLDIIATPTNPDKVINNPIVG